MAEFDALLFLSPDFMILVPILLFIGKCLKEFQDISDKWIPSLLGLIGILISCCYGGFTTENVFQGILAACVAVYGHQVVKQQTKLR